MKRRRAPANEQELPARERFRRFAYRAACWAGSPAAFLISVLAIIIWALLGPKFHYSDSWQLVINTSTSVITFLMVFLIQSTQNRDAKAIHLKLDELIRSVKGARNHLVRLEDLSDDELADLEKEFARLRERAESKRSAGGSPSSNGQQTAERVLTS